MLRHRVALTSSLHRYGDVVLIYLGPMPTYFVTSAELTYHVLVTEGNSFAKGIMFDKFRPYLGNGLILANGAFHLRQRRLIQPAFHRDRITRYTRTMARAVGELTGSWQSGEVREIDKDMQGLAVTIVGETLFATELGRRAIAEARRSIPVVIKQGLIRALSPALLEKLPIPGARQFDEAVERMRAVVLEIIADWRRSGVDNGDLLSMLLLAHDEGTGQHGMTDQQVHDEVLTLLTAGVETTALALAWTFHELARNPEIEQRVHAEVDEVLAGRPVAVDDIPKLAYANRVVDEVLRMYPIWILMRRATTDVRLGDVAVAAGAEVTVSPHAMHFDPRYYDDPYRFDPDRWRPERAKRLPRGAYVPFGAGNRQCVGNVFAHNEIVVTLATVAAKWRLVPVPDRPVHVKFTSAAYPSRMPMTAVPRK
jgi:cytochrome P450